VQEMLEIYTSVTKLNLSDIDDEDIMLSSGKAISSTKAAHCVLDLMRTVVFLRGIKKAILQLQADFPGQRLNILYAGTGPFATLLTPFTTQFTSQELAFYLMDINVDSLECVKKVYSSLGIDDFIAEVICTDATNYCLPTNTTMHLIISETMMHALVREPQVAIMLNLIPQMEDKTIFIPEEINVNLKLLSNKEEMRRTFEMNFEPQRISLGDVYSIGRHNCKPHIPVNFSMPIEAGTFNRLHFFTDITVYNDEQLTGYQCSLSSPVFISDVQDKIGKQIILKYVMGAYPKFEYEWKD
jgi:predicted RNA methylase